METVNVLTLKNNLSAFLKKVMQGQIIKIYKRSQLIATIHPVADIKSNKTQLGAFKDSGKILADITAPALSPSDWGSLYPDS